VAVFMMEIDAITKDLDHGHHSSHELQACNCVQEFLNCSYCKPHLKIIKEQPIKNSLLRMTLAANPCHGRDRDS